jgi:hypothetical protein
MSAKHKIEEAIAPSREERIALVAYNIWEQEGCPEGKSDEHWLAACAIIDAEDAAPLAMPAWLEPKQTKANSVEVIDESDTHSHRRRSAA